MAVTQAVLGFGCLLARAGVTVIEIIKITGPTMKADMKEPTNMGSPNGFKEFIGGLRDGGTISFEGNYIPKDASQAPLLTDFQAGSSATWTITLPGSLGVWTCTGYMQGIAPALPLDDRITMTGTLKLTGKPTLA